MTQTILRFGASLALGLYLLACGTESSNENAQNSKAGSGGGTNSVGGHSAYGGSSLGNGGSSDPGSVLPSGGSVDLGGATSASATTDVGAGPNAGGATSRTGSSATGGIPSAGGATSTSRASGGSGSTNEGGATTGGAPNPVGGAPSTGGAMVTGGTPSSSGGTTATTAAPTNCDKFSFFVTSLEAIVRESGSPDGFGGDLGGLAGADELCRRIAQSSLQCAGQKTWRAFLSTSTENAIARIGSGPWYDRSGRRVANTTSDLANTRPANADSAITNDLPNEFGTPNHSPDGKTVDNHDTLTGSNSQGQLYAVNATCSDWTSTTASGGPRVGHSWPGGPSQHWINAMNAPGCAPGINTSSQGNDKCKNSTGSSVSGVGCAGGYGGFYCFATTP